MRILIQTLNLSDNFLVFSAKQKPVLLKTSIKLLVSNLGQPSNLRLVYNSVRRSRIDSPDLGPGVGVYMQAGLTAVWQFH
jgi:hypothetical protein